MNRPVELGPNQPRQFYRGGRAIADLRGTPNVDERRPEDWVASATARYGLETDGLSRLPDGRFVRDAVEADPEGWLGPSHVQYFGAAPALLVKLLDAGQRLPVHMHPPRSFAFRHLGSRHGKTEAWVVVGTTGAEPVVYLGWSRDVGQAEVRRWVADQDAASMLGTLNKLPVEPGDAVLVPAGTPHSIGEGVFSVELQEPTDLSIMLEFAGFDIDPSGGEVGLGRELALSCVQEKAYTPSEIEGLRRRPSQVGEGAGTAEEVLPPAASPYFRAQRVRGGHGPELPASFAVIVALSGHGALAGDDWELEVKTGSTVVVPWGAGGTKVRGGVELLRCLPPLPSDAARDDPTLEAAGAEA